SDSDSDSNSNSDSVDGRITTALRGCRCVRRLVDKEIGEGARVGPLIGRAVRDARTGRRARGAQRCYERGPPQSVRLQPPTRKHSLPEF
ncbi:hypothetical protein EVAR_103687_1, partial [Eumeta japonica]